MVGGNQFKAVLAVLLLGGLLATAGAVASGFGDDKPVPKRAPAAVPDPAARTACRARNPHLRQAKGIRGVVKDSSGEPVAGAAVVTARFIESNVKPRSTTTDRQGRFAFDPLPGTQDESHAHVVVAKDGYAPTATYSSSADESTVVLPKAGEYSGTVKDRAGRPVAGAEVQFGLVTKNNNFTSWGYAPISVLRGTPVEKAYIAKTDAAGAFRFTSVPDGAQLIFRVNATGFAERDTGDEFQKREYVVGPDAKPAAWSRSSRKRSFAGRRHVAGAGRQAGRTSGQADRRRPSLRPERKGGRARDVHLPRATGRGDQHQRRSARGHRGNGPRGWLCRRRPARPAR